MKGRQTFSAIQTLTVVLQAIGSFAVQILLFVFLGFLFTDKFGAPMWIYVPLILTGVVTGIFGMIKMILSAEKNAEIIEQQRKNREREQKSYKENKENKENEHNKDS